MIKVNMCACNWGGVTQRGFHGYGYVGYEMDSQPLMERDDSLPLDVGDHINV